MNVLILTHHRLIGRFNGAVTRIRNLAEQLACQGAEVSVCAYISPRLCPLIPQELVPGCHYFEVRNQLQWFDGLFSVFGLPPYSITSFLNRLMPLSHLKKPIYDAVISESPFLWQITKRVKSRIKVLSAHNHEAAYHDAFSPRALAFLRQNEIQSLKEADSVVSVAEHDAQTFRSLNPQIAVFTVPNGFKRTEPILLSEKKLLAAQIKKQWEIPDCHQVALFIASNSTHNQRALRALLSIFSKADLESRWTLLVVGDVTMSKPLPKNVIECGIQRDLLPFLKGSDLALNPIFSGSGSNVKLMEYLGHGLPVLTTPFGVRGYNPHLKGMHVEPWNHFENRLISETEWTPPDPNELVPYEWASLGKNLFQNLQRLLEKQEQF